MKKRVVPILLLIVVLSLTAVADLKSYVQRPDDVFKYEVVQKVLGEGVEVLLVRLHSQTWQGMVWKHDMAIIIPQEIAFPNDALLAVGGGRNKEKPELDMGRLGIAMTVAMQTKSVTVALTQVPNQPIFEGRVEDEIIAYTYDKFLNGEGEDWPLLLPMAKSAVRAMDAVQAIMKEHADQEITHFTLTGGSKRGWTSWLAAASGDTRIKAIAPVVIDMLNLKEQMPHQLSSYGAFSSQIEDYTELKIQERMETEEGEALRSIVDPYYYRNELTLPKMVILGANDPYWAVDAANLYFPGLKGEKHLYYQANTAHDLSDGGLATLAQFYYSVISSTDMPEVTWKLKRNGTVKVQWDKEGGKAILWQAHSKTRDFRQSEWKATRLDGKGEARTKVETPEKGWVAYYVEVKFPGPLGAPQGITTQMSVLPDSYPEKVALGK